MKHATRRAAVLVMALSLFGVAQILKAGPAAADTLSKVKDSKYILLGFYNEPPHNWVEPTGGGFHGIDYEIAEAILKKIGVETINQIPVDWPGLIPGLQAGRWDMLAVGMSITPERAKQVLFTKPIYQYGSALIVAAGNPKGLKGLAQFSGHRIGAILGSTDADLIRSVSGAEFVAYKTHPDMLSDIRAGRIDGALADETTAGYANVVHPDAAVEILHDWQGKAARPTGFSFRLEDQAMDDVFNTELAAMKKDGTIAKILEKYGLTAGNIVQ